MMTPTIVRASLRAMAPESHALALSTSPFTIGEIIDRTFGVVALDAPTAVDVDIDDDRDPFPLDDETDFAAIGG